MHQPVDDGLPLAFIEIVSTGIAIRLLPGKHVIDGDHQRMCDRDQGTVSPTPASQAQIERLKIAVLLPRGAVGGLGQSFPQGGIPRPRSP